MKQIVFFLQTNKPLSSDQKIFITLAKYVSTLNKYQIYYVNNFFEEEKEYCEDSNLNYIDAKSFNESIFDDAVFFTPVNFLANLLCKISNLENAKICLLSYSAQSVDWLAHHLGNIAAKESIKKMIMDSGSCAFSDFNSVYVKNEKLDYSTEIFIPKSVDKALTKKYPPCPLINSEEINIAFYGEINKTSINSIENIIKNLIPLNIKRKINISLVGKICNYSLSSNFQGASQNVARIILTGVMMPENLCSYFRNEVDIVFASDNNALEIAQYGVPVVVPVVSSAPFVGNNYTWLFGANQYIYHWDTDSIKTLNNDTYTLKRILEAVYENGEKEDLANKCYEYIKNNASLEFCCNQLFDLISRSTLTVAECLAQNTVRDCIYDFKKVANKYDIDFNAYLEYRKNGYKDLAEKKNQELLNANFPKYIAVQNGFEKKIKIIQQQKKIKVAFIVIFKSTFPARSVFEIMIKSSLFDPYIIVVPNVSRSKQYQDELYEDTLNSFRGEFKSRVISGYDIQKNEYIEFKDEYKIVFFANPYKVLVHKYHDISYFLDKNTLPIYANYGFAAITYWKEVINTDFYNYLWKVSIENQDNMLYLEKNEVIKGINGVVTGYLKMYKLIDEKTDPLRRPTIMICPHHTVTGWKKLDISNFLKYSELFLKLPRLYPQIDFIFRPHPLLFPNLLDHKIWTKQEIEDYIKRISSFNNVVYDTSDNYFDKFVNSDAMIHDCGSFIAEYLYTKKPCCYMMKTKESTYEGLIPFGKKCMDNHYHALSEEDIMAFIDDIVVGGKDKLRRIREEFVEKELKINYPNSSRFFVDYIANQLKRKNRIK